MNCPTCWAKFVEKRRERTATRKEYGVCVKCRNAALPGRIHCHKHNAANNSEARAHRARLKWVVFQAYGGQKCSCCGETNFDFLTIDHINGGGCQHLKSLNGKLYDWLKRNNFPAGYRVLCWNCNCGRRINGGICPHESMREQVREKPAVDQPAPVEE